MKSQNKNLLKDNHGVALVMVMFLILVMTFMGGTMYAYTMQSLNVLEYGTARQKAEYIARSGIEASVFMYQDAMLKEGVDHADIHEFIQKTNDDKNDATDETITTNWIYLLKDGKTYKDGGNGDSPVIAKGDVTMGYFRVKITNDIKNISMDKGDGTKEEKQQPIKRFTSEGYCKNCKRTKKAYIFPLIDVYSKGWIDKDGQIVLDTLYESGKKSDSTSMIQSTKITIDCGWIDTLVNKALSIITKVNEDLMAKYPALDNKLPTYPNGRINNLPIYIGCTSGNMVLKTPKDAKTGIPMPIHFRKVVKDQVDGFLSMGNLFVNSSIDTEPLPTHFNSLILRGNKIVIAGDINLYVYDPQTNNVNGFSNWISGIAAKIARNYRFSTVVIGTPSPKTSTVFDPKPTQGLGQCGQVFFGGDVYVNFITRGEQIRKYKVFHAGDTYYFNGDFAMGKDDTNQPIPYGVDLLKYFLDTEISLNHRSPQVIQQFKRTREFYYNGKANTEYIAEDDPKYATASPDMRKIDFKKNKYDKITDTVLPSPGDGSYIIWE